MLVISRHAEQQVVFPHLGITVSILQVRGRLVKLGIDAPESVKVYRQELIDDAGDQKVVADQEIHADQLRGQDHRRRNELHLLQLRLQSLQRRIDRGEMLDPASTLQWLLGNVASIDREIGSFPTETTPNQASRPLRLLIVEDSDNERRLMAYLLAQHGFDVHVARDGLEALEQLRMWGGLKPDLVLMDMQMPMSNGLETLQRIREDEGLASLRVFAVTASPRQPEFEPVGRGWDGWFQKPVNIEKLIECIQAEASSLIHSTEA